MKLSIESFNPIPDDVIARALIAQVSRATPACGTECDVITHISRPMWQAWCRWLGEPIDSVPGPWKEGMRIFGSDTRIVESMEWWSISRQRMEEPGDFTEP